MADPSELVRLARAIELGYPNHPEVQRFARLVLALHDKKAEQRKCGTWVATNGTFIPFSSEFKQDVIAYCDVHSAEGFFPATSKALKA